MHYKISEYQSDQAVSNLATRKVTGLKVFFRSTKAQKIFITRSLPDVQ